MPDRKKKTTDVSFTEVRVNNGSLKLRDFFLHVYLD